jgi:hypothetical protein
MGDMVSRVPAQRPRHRRARIAAEALADHQIVTRSHVLREPIA